MYTANNQNWGLRDSQGNFGNRDTPDLLAKDTDNHEIHVTC